MTIRGLAHIAFGDDTDTDQELIEALTWDTELGFVTLSFTQGKTSLIESIQKNESIFAQSAEGIYQVHYFCPFRFLVPSAGASVKRLTLGLKSVSFHRGQYLAVME